MTYEALNARDPVEGRNELGNWSYSSIAALTRTILDRHGVVTPPVPIKDIVEAEGVDVAFVTFNTLSRDVAGLTNFQERRIYVNADDSLNRQTFTIAHEFGHWTLHGELFRTEPEMYRVLLRTPTGELNSDPLEKQANAFAASILMPANMIKSVRHLAGQNELARMFAVSPDAIRYRLKNVR